jgi:hypothetical protein
MSERQSDSGNNPQGSPSDKGTGSGWVPDWMSFGKGGDPTKKPVISNAEVFALLEYAASHGIETRKVKALSRAIHEPEPDPSECTSSKHMAPLELFSKRHFSARTFSSLACKHSLVVPRGLLLADSRHKSRQDLY